MQRAGASQPGPDVGSQTAPSAAGAVQVLVFAPVEGSQLAPAAHRVVTPSITPQDRPAATIGCTTHWFVIVLQVNPADELQSGPVRRVESQGAPSIATAGMQLPTTLAVEPTHASPSAQGSAREHAAPAAARG